MNIVKVGRRGQITLPSQIRKQAGIQEGDHLALVLDGETVVAHRITQTLLDLRGSVTVTTPQDFDAIRQQVLTGHISRRQVNEQ